MTTAQVVETSVTVNNNSLIQDYVHPDDQTQPTFEMTPGFKPFTKQNIASTKNCEEFLASQVPVLKRNKATNSSISNHPFFSCKEIPCIW